jgi:hypothetical protein
VGGLTFRPTPTGLDVYRRGVRIGEVARDDLPALVLAAAQVLQPRPRAPGLPHMPEDVGEW